MGHLWDLHAQLGKASLVSSLPFPTAMSMLTRPLRALLYAGMHREFCSQGL